jgi:hypothetical protein
LKKYGVPVISTHTVRPVQEQIREAIGSARRKVRQ